MYKLNEQCWNNALQQYKASVKRNDLSDTDRLYGAIQAYKRMEIAQDMKKGNNDD